MSDQQRNPEDRAGMWPHHCTAERAVIMVGEDEECAWCGARSGCDEPAPQAATGTRVALAAVALLVLAGCASKYRSPDSDFWRQATPHIKKEVTR